MQPIARASHRSVVLVENRGGLTFYDATRRNPGCWRVSSVYNERQTFEMKR